MNVVLFVVSIALLDISNVDSYDIPPAWRKNMCKKDSCPPELKCVEKYESKKFVILYLIYNNFT